MVVCGVLEFVVGYGPLIFDCPVLGFVLVHGFDLVLGFGYVPDLDPSVVLGFVLCLCSYSFHLL